MSRSTGEQGVSPAEKTFEWSSDNEQFKYYDKKEKKQLPQQLPFRFIVLDKLCTIRGFSDNDQSGFWSNDIRDTRTEAFVVRTKKGIEAEGMYADIKDRINAQGAKYATQLYIGYYEGEELTIGCLTLVGAANSAFIDFSKNNNIYKGAIEVKEFTTAKKGKTVYSIPTFAKIEISETTEQKSIDLDKQVQEYLDGYFLINRKQITKKEIETEPAQSAPANIKAKDTGNDWKDQMVELPNATNDDGLPF